MPDHPPVPAEFTQRRHQIPTHLQVPDKILSIWGKGITVRQLLILLTGWSVGTQIWVHLARLSLISPVGSLLRLVLIGACALLTLVVAFKQIAGRPLEVWLLILLRFWQIPTVWVWRSTRWDVPQEISQISAWAQGGDSSLGTPRRSVRLWLLSSTRK
jgi:hypothetical protein